MLVRQVRQEDGDEVRSILSGYELGNIEKGACNALNPNLSYTITKKLTSKDEMCEFVIEAVR